MAPAAAHAAVDLLLRHELVWADLVCVQVWISARFAAAVVLLNRLGVCLILTGHAE